MKGTKSNPWSDLLRQIRCSRGFVHAMNEQLKPPFHELTGLQLETFKLAPPIPDRFEVRTNGPVATLSGNLVGSRYGFPVVFAWSDRARLHAPRPSDVVHPSEVELWWQQLPANEIVEAENATIAPPFDMGHFPFQINFLLRQWPHVRLQIAVRDPVAQLDELRNRLVDVQTQYNRDQPHNLIHSVDTTLSDDKRLVVADIDFGSAGPSGLKSVFNALAELRDIMSVQVVAY